MSQPTQTNVIYVYPDTTLENAIAFFSQHTNDPPQTLQQDIMAYKLVGELPERIPGSSLLMHLNRIHYITTGSLYSQYQ